MMSYFQKKYIDAITVAEDDDVYNDIGATYTDGNYRYGIAGYLRKKHFEIALDLTKNQFYTVNVIDYGCADGPFLPSLSRYFDNIVGIDIDGKNILIASRLISKMNLNNVKLIHNKNIKNHEPTVNIENIKPELEGNNYKIIFLLETLEHVGNKNDLYNSQIYFLKELFQLIDEDGIIVISVPKMFGLSYLFQILGLKLLGQHPEQSCKSIKNLLNASFWIDCDSIEKLWDGGHEGYNYRKFEIYLKNNFEIVTSKDIIFQRIYVIKKLRD